jgi:hypothetical protein
MPMHDASFECGVSIPWCAHCSTAGCGAPVCLVMVVVASAEHFRDGLGTCACRKVVDTGVDVVKPQGVSLYPVSVEWRPPFSMLVPLKVPPLQRPQPALCRQRGCLACCCSEMSDDCHAGCPARAFQIHALAAESVHSRLRRAPATGRQATMCRRCSRHGAAGSRRWSRTAAPPSARRLSAPWAAAALTSRYPMQPLLAAHGAPSPVGVESDAHKHLAVVPTDLQQASWCAQQ